MKNDDEMYQSLLARLHDEQERRKQRMHTVMRTVPVCFCLAAGLWYGVHAQRTKLPAVSVQPVPAELPVTEIIVPETTAIAVQTAAGHSGSTEPVLSAETEQHPEPAQTDTAETLPPQTAVPETEPVRTEPAVPVQSEPPATAAAPADTAPPVTAAPRTLPPAVQTTRVPDTPENPGEPGTPGAVFTNLTVSYAEARERFGHPILPCEQDGFQRYQAGIVSKNGDIRADGAFCLSVTYVFADGTVTVSDWDRMHGSTGSLSAEQTAYCGKTFYLQPDEHDGRVRILYYAAGFDPSALSGLVYQADFGTDAEISEIMKRMISLMIA